MLAFRNRDEHRAYRIRRVAGTIVMLALLPAVAVITGCGLTLYGALDAPVNLVAGTPNTDFIQLTWDEVRGADVYYVYRSLSESGPFGLDGEYGTVPYRAVQQPVLLDTDTDPTSYFYAVSAGRLSTNAESALSEVVEGVRLAEEIGWQTQATVFGAPGTIRLAIDRTTPTVETYLLTVGGGTGATATVRQVEPDGTLNNLGGPAEPTDGTDPRVADLAAAGSLYVALVAEDSDTVILFRYDDELEEWLAIPGALMDIAHPSAPYITLVAIGQDDLLISYRDQDGLMAVYHYDGTLSTRIPAPEATNDIVNDGTSSIGLIDAAAVTGAAALIYELEDDGIATFGETSSLLLSVWDDPARPGEWSDGFEVYNGSSGDVADEGAGIAMDPTVFPAEDGIAVAYLDDAGIFIVDGAALPIADTNTGFSGVADLSGSSIALAAQSGVISLFYLDSAQSAGAVSQFDGGWTLFSPPDFTQSATPGALALAAGGGKLFAAFDDGGLTRLRAYQ